MKKIKSVDDLTDADLISFRNESIAYGDPAITEGWEREIEKRKAPELFRHSRRKQRK